MRARDTNRLPTPHDAGALARWSGRCRTRRAPSGCCALTGLDSDELRARAGDPALLAAVLGFLAAHEPDLDRLRRRARRHARSALIAAQQKARTHDPPAADHRLRRGAAAHGRAFPRLARRGARHRFRHRTRRIGARRWSAATPARRRAGSRGMALSSTASSTPRCSARRSVTGVIEALERIGAHADIVILTNLPITAASRASTSSRATASAIESSATRAARAPRCARLLDEFTSRRSRCSSTISPSSITSVAEACARRSGGCT